MINNSYSANALHRRFHSNSVRNSHLTITIENVFKIEKRSNHLGVFLLGFLEFMYQQTEIKQYLLIINYF